MLKVLFGCLLTFSLFSCYDNSYSGKKDKEADSTMAKLTDEEKKEGWELLFDGKTTKGWHTYGKDSAGSAWKVKDGYLYLDTSVKEDYKIVDGGNLLTDSSYENFDLKLEWNISKNGNSGIIFYVHEDTAKYAEPWHTGPEMQVLDNDGHPDGKNVKHRAGDLYDLISSSKETVKKPGEWNLAEVKCVNGKLDLYLNGENVVSTQLWDEAWKKLVAGSKFKDKADFGTYKKGKICLQDHDNEVRFRNIKIRKL
ncbi:MAG TPA: DUF1080 domain-containing protein [Chitinophagaceae bacterium]